MPTDTFTTTTTTGFGSRLQQSGRAACCAPIAILIACILLFWNEGRAVHRYQDLQESSRAVVELDPSSYDASLDGKLIHASGKATTEAEVQDQLFGISMQALQLRRNVEMYQWVEESHSHEEKQTGGSSKTTTTYEYYTTWKNYVVSSSNFAKPENHENPSSMKFQPASYAANPINFGGSDYVLGESITSRMNWWETYEGLSSNSIPDNSAASGAVMFGAAYYYGTNPAYPEVGDTRVSFDYVPETEMSIIAEQQKQTFGSYTTKRGGSVLLVSKGSVSAEAMIAQAQAENTMMTWILRCVGFVIMWIGTASLVSPLITFLDVLPFLGNLVECGVSIISFFVSALISIVIVAIAWLFYRPLLSVPLLLGVGGLVFYIAKKHRENSAGAAPSAGIPTATVISTGMKYDQVEMT